MRITLNGTRIVEIPDQSPTPRVYCDQEANITYVLATDNNYIPVPHYKSKSQTLVNANGSIVFNGAVDTKPVFLKL